MSVTNLIDLEAFHDDELNVVIETPKGSRNKYEYDERIGLFKLGGVLPSGASFPFDFGFVADARLHARVRTLESLGTTLLEEIEHFFVSYNQFKGKKFEPLGRFGPERARELVEEGMRQFRRKKGKRTA